MPEAEALNFDHLKEWDIVRLDDRRQAIVAQGKVSELDDDDLRELVAIAAQIRLRRGVATKEEKASSPKKTAVKKATSIEDLDL
jgi:hypothetical protein